jgi:hypothetical protein
MEGKKDRNKIINSIELIQGRESRNLPYFTQAEGLCSTSFSPEILSHIFAQL